jgi:lipopolysaccharide exporter
VNTEKEGLNNPTEKTASTVPSLRSAMIKGSLWMVAMRWAVRGIGIISTLILVRLLQPEDFGLLAMAMIVVGMMEVMSSFGVDLVLIRMPQARREHFDTAWTIGIIQGFAIAVVLVAIAPLAAVYFREPRVVLVLQVLACGVAVGGFSNIGIVLFRKELQFGREFNYTVARKVLSFVVTLSCALVWHNYWALLAGFVAGQLGTVVLSYLVHPMRPRWSLVAVRELWSVSQWMLLINVGNYLFERMDEFIVGRIGSSHQLGLYSVSSEISNLPTTELISPVARALLPGFAQLAKEPSRLVAAYVNTVGFVALMAIPAGAGIAAIAADLVTVLLGPKWTEAQPLIELLAYFGAVRAVYGGAGSLLVVINQVRFLAAVTWVQVATFAIGAYYVGTLRGVTGVAEAKVAAAALYGVMLFGSVCWATSIRWRDIGSALWRPILASVFMGYMIFRFHHAIFTAPLPSALADACAGALTYTASVLLLWQFAGRPPGAERFLLETIRKRLPV